MELFCTLEVILNPLKFPLDVNMLITDKGGRRTRSDRRQSASSIDFPDRRSGNDRRIHNDRRSGEDRRSPEGFRSIVGMDRRKPFRLI